MSDASFKKDSKLRYELKEVLTDFSENTSAHGPPKIVGRKYILAKVFWVVLFLTGIALFVFFGLKLVRTYLKYEKTTDIALQFEVLEFPAVTICNLNQFRLDKVPSDIQGMASDFIMEKRYDMFGGEYYFDYYFDQNPTVTPLYIPWWIPFWDLSTTPSPSLPVNPGVGSATTQPPGSSTGSPNTEANTDGYSEQSLDSTDQTVIGSDTPLTTGATLGRRRKRGIGNIDEDKLEVIQDMSDFYQRPNISKDLKQSWFSNVGETSADRNILLNLTHYISAYSSPEILEGYGHEIQEMLQECVFLGTTCGPNDFYQFYDRKYGNCYTFNSGMDGQFAKITSPGADYGLSLTLFINQPMYLPALASQAGIRVLLHRQGETPLVAEDGFNVSPGTKSDVAVKYVELERLEGEKYTNCTHQSKRPTDGSLHEYYPGNYTQQGCLKTCLQKGTIKQCGCANPLYRGPPNVLTCDITQVACSVAVVEELLEKGNCSTDQCPLPCWESQYQHTISTSQWPSNNYEPYLIQNLKTRSDLLRRILEDTSRDGFHEEFVRLEIYFDNLNFYRYTEKPKMTFEDLIGAIGGHLGLWIGMSVISFVEIFELIILLFGVCARRLCKAKNQIKSFAM